MTKSKMQGVLREQLEDKELVVKTMVFQDLIWPEYSECRLFTNAGEVYSAIFVQDEQETDFILCPKEVSK